MNDLIDRQAALDCFHDWVDKRGDVHAADEIVEYGRIEALPAIEPQWIPCSETADIPDHEIIACDRRGELIIGYLAYQDEQWLCESETEIMYDPIAWMEKPEPYKGEADG